MDSKKSENSTPSEDNFAELNSTLLGTHWDADIYNYGPYGPTKKEPYTLDTWRSKDGRIALTDMELRHLTNTIRLIMRKDLKATERLIFKRLLLEQQRREQEGDLW